MIDPPEREAPTIGTVEGPMIQNPPSHETAIRTHAQVARIMTERGYPMSGDTARQTEQRAIRKLREALENDA